MIFTCVFILCINGSKSLQWFYHDVYLILLWIYFCSTGWNEVKNWPKDNVELGQASGVSLDSEGLVYVFHRGDRQWGYETFDLQNRLRDSQRSRGPIPVPTVIIFHPVSGEVLKKWGQNLWVINAIIFTWFFK